MSGFFFDFLGDSDVVSDPGGGLFECAGGAVCGRGRIGVRATPIARRRRLHPRRKQWRTAGTPVGYQSCADRGRHDICGWPMRDDVGGYFLSERRIPGCAGMAGGPEQLSTGLANDAATFRYRTDDLPLLDWVSAWREYLSHFLIEIELKPDHPRRTSTACDRHRSLHDLQLLKMTFTAAQIIRKASHGEGSDYFVLHVNFSGVVAVSSMGRQLTLNEGDAVLLDGARPDGDGVADDDRCAKLYNAGGTTWSRLGDGNARNHGDAIQSIHRARLLHGAGRPDRPHHLRRARRNQLRDRVRLPRRCRPVRRSAGQADR